MSADVIEIDTPATRAALVKAHLAKHEPLVEIRTREDALRWGDGWQRQAERLELLLMCAEVHRDASDTLWHHYEAEVERLRGIVERHGITG